MRNQICLLLFLLPLMAIAQKTGSVQGKLLDSASHQSLSQATISLHSARDSSFISYGLADKNGLFEIRNLDTGYFRLQVSFGNYQQLQRLFHLTKNQKNIDLGVLYIQPEYKSLEELTLQSQANVKIKDDTISYRLAAFTSSPGETLEDALKKLPGIQVQKDGTIKAMGETVQKLYVDGKQFFGNDPKMTTKNLTAEMVDQVQVFDDMSEQAKFTKIDDGSRSKTINIKLKKDRKKGEFGRLTAGAGTDHRYDGNMNWNRFSDATRISLLGSASNTNTANYDFGNSSFSSGGAVSQPGSSSGLGGINTNRAAAVNYNDQWGSKMDARSSYQFSNNENLLTKSNYRRSLFPGDSVSVNNASSETKNINSNHRVNTHLEFKFDSTQSLLYTANLSFNESSLLFDESFAAYSEKTIADLALSGLNNKAEKRDANMYNGELLYRRKLNLPGKTFTLGWKNDYSKNGTQQNLNSELTSYNFTGLPFNLSAIDQESALISKSSSNSIGASYTHPAGKNKLVEVNYSYNANKSESDKRAFDFNPATSAYDISIPVQTNSMEFKQHASRLGANYKSGRKKLNYQVGMSVQWSESVNKSFQAITSKDSVIRMNMTNFFPAASFNFMISKTTNLRINYRGRTNSPTSTQLQDAPDNSNPLFIRTGNPGLKQEFISNLNLAFSTYHVKSQAFFNASMSFSNTGNKIVNSIDSFQSSFILIRPENLNGSYSGSGNISFGKPFKKIKGLMVNITTMGFYSKDANLVYKTKNFTKLLSIEQSIGLNYHQERFQMSIGGVLNYNDFKFDLQPGSNTSYLKGGWSGDFTYRFKKNIFLFTHLDYMNHSGRSAGYNQEITMWNMALGKQFLRNNNAEIKLSAYDILNQNKGISRITGENYFEDSRLNVTPRFFMLSLTYNFKRTIGKKNGTAEPEGKMNYFK